MSMPSLQDEHRLHCSTELACSFADILCSWKLRLQTVAGSVSLHAVSK